MVFRHTDMFCFPSISLFLKGILRHLPLPTNVHFRTWFSAVIWHGWALFTQIIFCLVHQKVKAIFSRLYSIFSINSISLVFFSRTSTSFLDSLVLLLKLHVFSSVYTTPCFKDESLSTLVWSFLISESWIPACCCVWHSLEDYNQIPRDTMHYSFMNSFIGPFFCLTHKYKQSASSLLPFPLPQLGRMKCGRHEVILSRW